MIKGKKVEDLTIKSIMQKISPYDIYRFYLGDFRLGKAMKSPFRRERNASFVVRVSQMGNLYHIDFADDSTRGDAIELVQQLFSLNLNEALIKIDKDFGLGMSGGPVKDYQRIIAQYEQPDFEKEYAHILVITRPMTNEELAYWNQYHLSEDDLKAGHIYGIRKLFLNRRLIPNYGKKLRFAYKEDASWKIYKPYETKGKKFDINNIPAQKIEDLEVLTNTEKGIITKSRKDRLVLKKLYPYVCSVQYEAESAIDNDDIEFIKENCANPYIGFDNDAPGKKASRYYTSTHGFKHINVPDSYFSEGITDFADLAKAYGLDKLQQFLQTKNILT